VQNPSPAAKEKFLKIQVRCARLQPGVLNSDTFTRATGNSAGQNGIKEAVQDAYETILNPEKQQQQSAQWQRVRFSFLFLS
jgi:hypothetical protein